MFFRYWNHLWTEMSATGRRTMPWDLVRGVSDGALTTIRLTFAILVAIKYFDASIVQKSVIAGAHAAGLLLSLGYASWSMRLGRKSVRAAAPMLGAFAGLAVAAAARDASMYTAGMVLFGVFGALPVPAMTAIYGDNYSGHVRGQVFGVTVLVMVVTGLVAQFAGGELLDRDLAWYRWVYAVMAALALMRAAAVLQMPDAGKDEHVPPNPLRSFGAVRDNPMFGYVLLAWFMFGFANLSLQPQRIEYLSQARYGIQLNPGAIVLITGVTVELTRLLVIPLWARLFDRFNFILLRIALCGCFLAYILLYYNTSAVPLLVLGSVFLGMGFGGGAIAWTLWVTKFAPPAETARYMACHTFLTGVRGSLAPLVGYAVVEHLSIETTSRIAAVMVGAAMLLLWRIRNAATRPAG